MATRKKVATKTPATGEAQALPRSLALWEQGIETAHDMLALHSAMTADVVSGRVDRRTAQKIIAKSRTMIAEWKRKQ